ncbi:MAG TPA: isoprenylcysteine carboxylmethyltransferase family protein [Candidatus Polarisedimenticolia bacterium]|jgi:protein-S-isoprenylcysteine O-methyltransferase Ste14|nr:isoprenylcysteine carboxylmethyltransferase family protein [Candidatus Polarisedimenticolia bacterium]
MPSWSRVATRSRVPLGFVFAAAYFWFARPTWASLGAGFAVETVGVIVRALASGHIRKNAALATTGPYAHTRNPLYLGSIIIAVGFIIAARNVWIGVAALAMFAFIYLPVIAAEEKYLRSTFSDYDRYASEVPRFLPRLTPYRAGAGADDGPSQFSSALYLRHREYNAALGSILMLGALLLKMLVKH